MALLGAGFRNHGDGSAAGEVKAMGDELGGGRDIPHATMEENEDRPGGGRRFSREKYVGVDGKFLILF